MKSIFAAALGCGCIAASGLAADPIRALGAGELDRIVAGACLAGAPGPCNDTPGLPPTGLGPGPGIPAVPLGLLFIRPGYEFQAGFCFGSPACSSSTSAAVDTD